MSIRKLFTGGTPMLLIALLIGGCASINEKSAAEQQATLKMYVQTADELGIELYAFGHLPARVGMFNKVEFGSDGDLYLFLRMVPDVGEAE